MPTSRRTTRRSFLASVAGGGFALGGLAWAGAAAQQQTSQSSPTRQMVVDADPGDPARPPPAPRPAPPPSPVTNTQSSSTDGPAPQERFVICPGNVRCPS